jgi:hypothetical protein
MILIVTYDLRTPKDYHDFYEAIKAQGEQGKWWHYMASTWLLSTSKSPSDVAEALRPHMDNQDFLFVCELAPNYQGWLPKPAWDWINAELKKPYEWNALLGAALGGQPSPLSDLINPTPPPAPWGPLLPTIPPKKPWEPPK